MRLFPRFIKLMKSEPPKTDKQPWLIDESKCLNKDEVIILRKATAKLRKVGLKESRFSLIRDWFMVELGLNAGLRVSEMASLTRDNLNINGEKCSILIVGKGQKKRSVWISNLFKKTCLDYLQYRKQFGFDSDYLLNNLDDRKISKRSLQKFFKKIIKEAKLPDHYAIHCLRHTYATFLLEASNHNYRFVQRQLGHSSIRTTQIYAAILEKEGRTAVENLYRKEIGGER